MAGQESALVDVWQTRWANHYGLRSQGEAHGRTDAIGRSGQSRCKRSRSIGGLATQGGTPAWKVMGKSLRSRCGAQGRWRERERERDTRDLRLFRGGMSWSLSQVHDMCELVNPELWMLVAEKNCFDEDTCRARRRVRKGKERSWRHSGRCVCNHMLSRRGSGMLRRTRAGRVKHLSTEQLWVHHVVESFGVMVERVRMPYSRGAGLITTSISPRADGFYCFIRR